MGAVTCCSKDNGGCVVGVIPELMQAREMAYTKAEELISVSTMRERMQITAANADGFLALVGGWGPWERFLAGVISRPPRCLPATNIDFRSGWVPRRSLGVIFMNGEDEIHARCHL